MRKTPLSDITQCPGKCGWTGYPYQYILRPTADGDRQENPSSGIHTILDMWDRCHRESPHHLTPVSSYSGTHLFPGWLVMCWNMVTNQNPNYKWQTTEAGISGPSGQKLLALKTRNCSIYEFAVWARTGISHCPLADVLITATSEHTRCRRDPHRSILVPEECPLS